jgi:hypothetical protein
VISPKTLFSMTNKTDHNNDIEILLKVALDIKTTQQFFSYIMARTS